MRIAELVAVARLRLRVLAGADRVDRDVTGAYTTDLLRPERYLSGGEIVLTGMMWRTGPADSEEFVSSVAAAGAACLAAGTALGEVPDDLVAACARHGLPLLEVPAATSFAEITEEVLRSRDALRRTALAATRDRHRRLLADVAAGADFPAAFAEAAAEAGLRAWVLSSTGRAVASAGPGMPAADRELAAERALTPGAFPRRVELPAAGGPRAAVVAPVRTRGGHPLAGWLLVVEGDPEAASEEVREAVAELGALAALARSRAEEREQDEARHVEGLPRLLAAQRFSEAAALLRLPADDGGAGGAGAAHVVVSAALLPAPRTAGLARRVTAELLAGTPGAVVAGEDEALAVVRVGGGGPAGAAEAVRAELVRGARVLEAGLAEHRLAVGVASPVAGVAGLRGAAVEARHARRLAEVRGGRSRVIAGAEIDSHELLLASVPEDVRTSYRDRLLGPLLAYDRDHRSDLVATLRRFLEHSGSWQRCAAAMHVHVNTLRYRIGRVEELTGRDLSRLEDRVDLFLALRLRD
ncbi:PucR family transcriptional regulator [Nocardiopsis trehalosi]|uniref:PucR family transcriptional regulator n=1 Tax=Nocardiopsis trehalosi TaxID=109329 RepID=UPI0008313B12|nr:PucR family transcriptional regulator [Nocardiopsis trehalosi]